MARSFYRMGAGQSPRSARPLARLALLERSRTSPNSGYAKPRLLPTSSGSDGAVA